MLFNGVLLCSYQKRMRYKKELRQTELIENQMIESKMIDIIIRVIQENYAFDEQFIRLGLRIPND